MVAALEDLPGVTEVTVFGSTATSRCDQFSDIDIHATTIDAGLTLPGLYHALSRIGTVDLEWPRRTGELGRDHRVRALESTTEARSEYRAALRK